MGITKPCTQLHPAPPSSIHMQLISTSTQLILASTQVSATPSKIFEPKYRKWLGNFPKFRQKNSKSSTLTENWHIWYLGGVESESRHIFLKLLPQNPFLGKFGPIKSKLFVLSEYWHTWYLKVAYSYSNIIFLNFQT